MPKREKPAADDPRYTWIYTRFITLKNGKVLYAHEVGRKFFAFQVLKNKAKK